MRASHPAAALYLAALAFLGAAALAYTSRRPGEEAQLVASALAVICVCGTASALLQRRLLAGLCALIGILGAWATTGGIDWWLLQRGRLLVDAALVPALIALALAKGEPRDQ